MTQQANPPAVGNRFLFLAFSTFNGDVGEIYDWYDNVHIRDAMKAGAVAAQRFLIDGTRPLPGVTSLDFGHLAMYDLEGEPSAFRENIKQMLISGEMVVPDFLNRPFSTMFLKPVSELFVSEAWSKAESLDNRHLFFAFSTYTSDYETYARWYDEEHIPQVMSAPGMLRAQRFLPADVKPLPGVVTPDLGHLALYEMDGSPAQFREIVKQMLISGEMVIPDFMVQPFSTIFMRPVSPMLHA